MKAPLEGIKVLDLTIYQNGPYATVILAELGADVIKIEDPVNGDAGRTLIRKPHPKGLCLFFEANNRSKRSVTLDLKSPRGREVFYHMVKSADVVVQSFRPGVAERLGIDYKTVSQYNPKIICASATGFGREGPDAKTGVFDILGMARSGLMKALTFPGERVEYLGLFALADQVGAFTLALATMTALVARERYGVGQDVEVSQLGAVMMLQQVAINEFLALGVPPSRPRRTDARNPLFNAYECQDKKWIALSCMQSDRYWHDYCQIARLEELEHDPRYKDQAARALHNAELIGIMDHAFTTRPRHEWLQLLSERDILCTPVNDFPDLLTDPQVLANHYLVEMDHPVAGKMKHVGMNLNFSATPARVLSAAPEFGQHTEEVLMEFGYTWDQIEKLREERVI